MLDHGLTVIFYHYEKAYEYRKEPVHPPIAHLGLDLDALTHESWHLDMFDLIVDID